MRSFARVLSQFKDDVVLAVCDPAGGIALFSERIPTLKVLGDFCVAKGAVLDHKQHVAQAKPAPKIEYKFDVPFKLEPNLWVADCIPCYEQMQKLHKKTKGVRSNYESRTCSWDSQVRMGIWVPAEWYNIGGLPTGWRQPKPDPVEDFV